MRCVWSSGRRSPRLVSSAASWIGMIMPDRVALILLWTGADGRQAFSEGCTRSDARRLPRAVWSSNIIVLWLVELYGRGYHFTVVRL